MNKGPFSNPSVLKALKLLSGGYSLLSSKLKVASDFYKASSTMYYKAMGKEEPTPKVWSALKAKALRVYRRALFMYSLTFMEMPKYVSSNSGALLKYSFFYLLLWLQEGLLGMPLEYLVMGPFVFFMCLDILLILFWPKSGALYLLLLKSKELAKKSRSKFQSVCSAILLNFFMGARSFLSNPLFRISKVQTLSFAALLWYVGFAWNLFEAFLCMGLCGSKIPQTYAPASNEMLDFVQSLMYNFYLCQSQSFVVNWVMSLTVFLAVVSNVWLMRNFDLTPSMVGSLLTLGGHFMILPALQASKILFMDGAIVLLGMGFLPVSQETASSSYMALLLMWAALYYSMADYLYTRGTSSSVDALHHLTQSDNKGVDNGGLAWTVTFLSSANLTIGISSLMILYGLGKALCFFFLGGFKWGLPLFLLSLWGFFYTDFPGALAAFL